MRLLGVLSVLLLSGSLVGAANKPSIYKKEFESLPERYFYFDDSSVILSLESESGIVWRSDNDGKDWEKAEKVSDGKALDVIPHPFDNKKAYVMSKSKTQYMTSDRGKTWQPFNVQLLPTLKSPMLSFHATKPGYILYTGMECEADPLWGGYYCEERTYYTKDGFDSDPKLLTDRNTHGCMFTRSTAAFDKGSDYTILCIVDGAKGDADNRILLTTDDFFDTSTQPLLDGERTISGVAAFAAVKKFILVAVRSAGTDEMALFVSSDAVVWDRAEFPSDHGTLKQDAYTILESTLHSIQIDVLTTSGHNPMGALFTSNSNGTYFRKNIDHTNRNRAGNVDFEQVQNIQGISLVNIVENAEDILKSHGHGDIQKKVVSKITFDGGRTFKNLQTKDKKNLHVHSVTDIKNLGPVFSSPAPGFLMAVGNTGSSLKSYNDGDLYYSDDAGLTWDKALSDAHKFEFGDSGSIMVAVYDEGRTDKLKYSLDHGGHWKEVDLGVEVHPLALTTVQDSTSKKFTLIADSKSGKSYIFSINFDGVFDRKCKDSDMEKWYARYDDDGNPDCLMGHKQYFMRRKKDAECFVEADYKDPVPEEENCPCTDEDYECDFEFAVKGDSGKCELIGRLIVPDGACKSPGDKFKGSSGYRLIPGNTCNKDKGIKKDEPVERTCGEKDAFSPPATGKIKSYANTFDSDEFVEYYYLERQRTSEGKDETIVARDNKNQIWVTHDQGGKWEQPKELKGKEINAVYPHPYFKDRVYFLTPGTKFYYSLDRCHTIKEGTGLAPPTIRDDIPLALRFHPTRSDLMIWIADRDCSDRTSKDCHSVAHYTTNRGDTWDTLLPYVRNCAWVHSKILNKTPEKLAFCERYSKEERPSDNNPIQLIASDDLFHSEHKHFEQIMGFATMEEFIVVAAVKDDGSLKLDASIDGKIFAEAKFPHNFQVDKQQAYTVLDSVTHAVFLHVTVNPMHGQEYGSIIKSNSNGTSYVLSLNNVNRNTAGYVDFEKMQGLEGVAVVNVLNNVEEVNKGAKKQLKSMITHNDGGDWNYITAPEKDVDGNKYSCNRNDLKKCSLNLHGYTERRDPRDTFSSGSAIGLMIGVGNVGEYLTPKSEGDTFLTRDGGITWIEIRKGSYQWEYGDQGSIIVIVDENKPTNMVYYSLDEGGHWNEYKFQDDKIMVNDITTVPSDTSRRFLLWGTTTDRSEKSVTISIDFTGLTDSQCKYPNTKTGDTGDFEVWEPKHPNLGNSCLFGHRVQYYRKKTDTNCYLGPKLPDPIIVENCPCERHDFECDYNYERGHDGKCYPVPNTEPPNHEAVCAANRTLVEWYKPTGYRRVPLTQCVGGKELDKTYPMPCPGHENEFNDKHGASRVAIAFGVIFAFCAAGAVGWWVWNNWSGKFGAIRLGEERSSSGQSPVVRYAIVAISAIVAVTVAIPQVLSALGGWVLSKIRRPTRYTTRGSFARGNYAVVDNDDGELLGSDDDDDL